MRSVRFMPATMACMSDERLRETQRLAALGDPDAEARALLLRLRAGALDEDRLALLAHVGHTPACRALGLADPAVPDDLEAWVRALARWGRPVEVAAAAAAARLVLPLYEAARPDDPRPRRAVEAAEGALEDDDATSVLEDVATAARETMPHTAQRAAWSCYHAAATVHGWEPSAISQAGLAAFEALLALRDATRLRDTIRDRIVAWTESA